MTCVNGTTKQAMLFFYPAKLYAIYPLTLSTYNSKYIKKEEKQKKKVKLLHNTLTLHLTDFLKNDYQIRLWTMKSSWKRTNRP